MTSIKISILDQGYLVSHITPTDHKRYAIEYETTLIRTIKELLGMSSCGKTKTKTETENKPDRAKFLLTARPVEGARDICEELFHPGNPANIAETAASSNSGTSHNSSTASAFKFKECAPFSWQSATKKKFGKTIIHQLSRSLHITRLGYQSIVFADIDQLRQLHNIYLKNEKGEYMAGIKGLSYAKRTVLTCCMKEVNFTELFAGYDQDPDQDPDQDTAPVISDIRPLPIPTPVLMPYTPAPDTTATASHQSSHQPSPSDPSAVDNSNEKAARTEHLRKVAKTVQARWKDRHVRPEI